MLKSVGEWCGVKCDENGGCPIGARVLSGPEPITVCAMTLNIDCHLTLDHFPLIRAMLAGEWKCETCGKRDAEGRSMGCALPAIPCKWWEPKEGSAE